MMIIFSIAYEACSANPSRLLPIIVEHPVSKIVTCNMKAHGTAISFALGLAIGVLGTVMVTHQFRIGGRAGSAVNASALLIPSADSKPSAGNSYGKNPSDSPSGMAVPSNIFEAMLEQSGAQKPTIIPEALLYRLPESISVDGTLEKSLSVDLRLSPEELLCVAFVHTTKYRFLCVCVRHLPQ